MKNKKQEQLREEFRVVCMESMDEDKLWNWIEKALQQKEEDVMREMAVELHDMAHDIIDHRNNAFSAQEKDWHEGQLHLVKKLIEKLTKTK